MIVTGVGNTERTAPPAGRTKQHFAACVHQLMKNFVKAMGQTGPVFRQLPEKFPGISALEITGLFLSDQILQTLQNSETEFIVAMKRGCGLISGSQPQTFWQITRLTTTGNCGKPIFVLSISRLHYFFEDPFFLYYHQYIFSEYCGALKNEHGECIHYVISAVENVRANAYQQWWWTIAGLLRKLFLDLCNISLLTILGNCSLSRLLVTFFMFSVQKSITGNTFHLRSKR